MTGISREETRCAGYPEGRSDIQPRILIRLAAASGAQDGERHYLGYSVHRGSVVSPEQMTAAVRKRRYALLGLRHACGCFVAVEVLTVRTGKTP